MIDILALALSHGLLALAAWRLILRADLDIDTASTPTGAAAERRDAQGAGAPGGGRGAVRATSRGRPVAGDTGAARSGRS